MSKDCQHLTEREFQIMNVAIELAMQKFCNSDPKYIWDDAIHYVTDRLPFEVTKEDIENFRVMTYGE